MQSLLPMPAVPDEATLLQRVVSVIQLSQGDLVDAPLSVWVRNGVLLQDQDAVPPVHPV